LLTKICQKLKKQRGNSFVISDREVIKSFTANPANTFLVSFPRTGSHWLRMIMELYFGRPSLTRIFYYPERSDYLTLHTHDFDLETKRSHVIYLYRNPVDTMFSQLSYHKEPLDDHERITYWSDLYGRHLDKWLQQENFTLHKTILTYEGLKQDLAAEFGKVTSHFGQSLDRTRLENAAAQVTKNELKRQTKDDPQVVQLRSSYQVARQEFHKKQGALVWDSLTKGRSYLFDKFKM
jgi:hypothetical protein